MNKKNAIPKLAYICKALLKGEVLTIMDGFHRFYVTNLPREISRDVEQKFGVQISRDRVDFMTEIGVPGFYFRYRLNASGPNEEGIQRMRNYISKYFTEKPAEPSILKQIELKL